MQLEAKKMVTAQLVGGPCDGVFVSVPAFNAEVWQRAGKPGRVNDADSQIWLRYVHDPLDRARYTWSGDALTTQQLGEALKRSQDAGNTYGETYGA